VSFSERKADSHGAWIGANGALEIREGSSIAIDEPSGFSGSWVADTFLFSFGWSGLVCLVYLGCLVCLVYLVEPD
jgi:hypothetical protein